MGLSPLVFTGVSKFSEDFQSILSRAASIAGLPVKALQNDQASMMQKSMALIDLNTSAASFADSLEALGRIGETKSLAASSSNSSVLTASISGTAQAGVYTINEVTSLAKAAVSTSAAGVATANNTAVAGGDNYLQLVVGTTTYNLNLSPEQNNLNGVRDAINALGAGVSASIVQTSDPSNPYFLTVSALKTGAGNIELRTTQDVPASNLLAVTVPGANAQFKINGQSSTSSSNDVKDVIPGVTFSLTATTEQSTTVTVAAGRNSLKNALQSFVDQYNALSQGLDAQTGEQAGVLSGQSLVRDIRDIMRSASYYRTSGNVGSLTDLGIKMDQNGSMTLDTSVVDAMDDTRLAQTFSFLGTTTTGMGSFAKQMRTLTDPISGTIKTQQDDYSKANLRISEQIAKIQERITISQQTLSARLQAADVLLASLESQQSMLTASISSLNLVLFGKNTQ